MILKLAIGDIIYADSKPKDCWDRYVIERFDDLMDIPAAAAGFDKDWAYNQKPEGCLQEMLLVSRQFHTEICEHVLPTREFMFGDVPGFINFFNRSLFVPQWDFVRKVNLFVWREGVCLMPLSSKFVEIALEDHEPMPVLTPAQASTLGLGLASMTLTEFKITVRDGIKQIGKPSLEEEIDDNLMQAVAEAIATWSSSLNFVEGVKKSVEIHFEDDLGKYSNHWTIEGLQ